MVLKQLIININEILEWEPNNIFYKIYINDNFKWRIINTELGEFLERFPFLTEMIIKGVYYIIAWPLYTIIKLIWFIFRGTCFPQKWFE